MVCCRQGRKGDKGDQSRVGTVVVPDANNLPTGYIEGPPGPPGLPGIPGKKVSDPGGGFAAHLNHDFP